MRFTEERHSFWEKWWADGDLFLSREGDTLTDGARDIVSSFAEGFTMGLLDVAGSTDRLHERANRLLAESFNEHREYVKPFFDLRSASESGGEFLIQALSSPGESTSYQVLTTGN